MKNIRKLITKDLILAGIVALVIFVISGSYIYIASVRQKNDRDCISKIEAAAEFYPECSSLTNENCYEKLDFGSNAEKEFCIKAFQRKVDQNSKL